MFENKNINEITKYKRIVMFLLGLTVIIIHTSIFWFVWYRFYNDIIVQPFYRRGNWLIVAIYVVLLFAFSKIYSGYKIGSLRISEIIYSQTLALCFTNVIAYAQISLIGRKFMWFIPILLLTIAQISFCVLWACISNMIYYRVFPPHNMILVYGGGQADRLMNKMKQRTDKYLIKDKVSANEPFQVIAKAIQRYDAVVLCDVKSEKRNLILKFCYNRSLRVYITPKISDIVVGHSDKIHLFDTPLFLCTNTGLTVEQRVAKKILDLLLSLIALIISSPFMLLAAILIKAYDGGPILFKQERLTINGKTFKVLKFRSMVIDAEKDGVARLSSKNDDRITPIGKFIRKTRIDELPQLFNVLKGDMSIVGPRPERPEIAKAYKENMPEFDFRLKVKAGLTGYAQVMGKYNTVPYDKLKLDMIYIEGYSIFLDLKLILMTLKVLFLPDSTQGIDEGNTTALD